MSYKINLTDDELELTHYLISFIKKNIKEKSEGYYHIEEEQILSLSKKEIEKLDIIRNKCIPF